MKVHNWFLANKLVLNVSKTHFMTFGNNSNISNVDLVINGLEIEQLKTVKFLGVFIDEDIKWKSHVSNILTNVSINVGIINKMRDYLPQHILLLLYNSLVLPHLNYCIILWGCCNKYVLERLYKLQKRAVRIVTQSSYLSHSKPLFIKLRILPIFQLYEYNLGIFMFLFKKQVLPDMFNSLFVQNSDVHNYNTRTKSHLRVEYGTLKFSHTILTYK